MIYNVGKYGRVGQTTGDKMAHALCMLGNQGYRHTYSEYVKQFFFTTAILVTRTHLIVTL
jgi:hypothetical protein